MESINNKSHLPSLQEVDELLAFLPVFEDKSYEPVVAWHGGVRSEDGVLVMPFPEYDQTTQDFIRIISKACWNDYGYEPTKVGQLLMSPDYVKACSLEQIKSLLTYCLRGERFGDGHWEKMIKDGYILQILTRLEEIRPSLK